MSGIKTAGGGTISYHNYQGSIGYAVYIPGNVNENTPIFTYTYGSGGKSGWWSNYHETGKYGPFDGLIANGGDSIVVMPTMRWGADWGETTMGIINTIREEYGITNLNVSGSGFSMGGFAGFDIVAENLKQNKNLDPQLVFFIDDYSSTYYTANKKLTAEKAQLFVENNTIFFTYDPPWKSADNYQAYLDAGINIIRVEPTNYEHIAIRSNFFKNGIYNYIAGGSLPQDGYTYKMYNRETETWEVIDYNEISTIDKLYSYCGISALSGFINRLSSLQLYEFGSDKSALEGYLNNIMTKIKNSSFLTTSFESFGGSSITKVPSQIPACVQNYFAKVARNLESLTSLMNTIAEIDPTYRKVDQDLANTIVEDNITGNANVSTTDSTDKELLTSVVADLSNTANNMLTRSANLVEDNFDEE